MDPRGIRRLLFSQLDETEEEKEKRRRREHAARLLTMARKSGRGGSVSLSLLSALAPLAQAQILGLPSRYALEEIRARGTYDARFPLPSARPGGRFR
jgi:hypothetical protein